MLRTQSTGCPLFTGTPPHTLSSSGTIQLQAVRLLIERRTRAASKPLVAHIHTRHHPAQPPTGASFSPISCAIRASGRPPRPSVPPERRPHSDRCRKRRVKVFVVPKAPCASSRVQSVARTYVSPETPRIARNRPIRAKKWIKCKFCGRA